ncbi:MAG: DAK2 domain-containing protein [Eubacterium sp.]|nr:DAK2 domain-containing protein [Eubacterium sp.]
MQTNTIDAQLLAKMFLAGAKNLESKKEWINELNVFPVPDGDTGTNMTMTILSAAREVSALDPATMPTFAKAVSSGSLRGARGNSGVILSQLLRGFSKVVEKVDVIDKPVIGEAFERAVETAYKAVMKPKEGTILTVAKAAATVAMDLAYDDEYDMEAYLNAILEEAERILALTPEMLPVLKQAGVVDSGGQGLVCVLSGARDAFLGKEIDYSEFEGEAAPKPVKISAETEEEIKFGYCTEFIVVIDEPISEEQEMDFRAFLEGIGDSIVLVADDDLIKVHVHTNEPGNALQKGLSLGSLSRIKIDNMREEHQERLFKDAEKLAAQQAEAAKEKEADTPKEPEKEMGFVAVTAGEGLASLFTELGVDILITGGQTMNPCTEDFLDAIEKISAKTIFLFPNNKNILLAANQAAEMSEGKDIVVIPTTTIPQGITAMINYIPEQSAEENAETMKEIIETVHTGEVTYAIRDTMIDDISIKEGDYMGIADGKIRAAGASMSDVTKEMVLDMTNEETSLICIYYGEDRSEEDAQALAEEIEAACPDHEIEVHLGGQPVYYYIISVE